MGAYYWYVEIPQLGYMGHGLKYIAFYVKKTYNTSHSLSQLPTGSREAARGACIYETGVLLNHILSLLTRLYLKLGMVGQLHSIQDNEYTYL